MFREIQPTPGPRPINFQTLNQKFYQKIDSVTDKMFTVTYPCR